MTHCKLSHNWSHSVCSVSTECYDVCPAIDNPTISESRAVICFLHDKNMSAGEIHHELCTVYAKM
jgi:hypothetical protein